MSAEMNRNYDFESHDALVLIHPTWSKENLPKSYPHKLLNAVDLVVQHGKPVFHVPDEGNFRWLHEHLSKRHTVRVPNYLRNVFGVKRRVLRRRLQKEVDFIARILEKRPGEIRLGFAGMYADACVFSVAQSWCREVVPWYLDEVDSQFRSCLPRRPIARGEILEELVVGFTDGRYLTSTST